MLRFGACYHPEQWTPEQAKDHVKLMVKARMNTVRMGENCWCKFEPEQGKYRFDWLDPIIESLHKENISTVLCTPTSVAPPWVHVRHPNVRRFANDRHAAPGTPHACCVNAPEFQILTDALVQSLARHYAKIPGVIAWQVDNRLFVPMGGPCRCEHCLKAFRQWLIAKYETTDRLNEVWHASTTGAEVRQWNEVNFPSAEYFGSDLLAGPSLDFARFSSNALMGYHKRQADLIREYCPEHKITSNLPRNADDVDMGQFRDQVDSVGGTNTIEGRATGYDVFNLSRLRGAQGPFWLMEQTIGNCDSFAVPEPGDIRRGMWQAIAHGAEMVLLHPFRSSLAVVDPERLGVLDWDGIPRRRFKEAVLAGDELRKLGPEIESAIIDAKVAVMFSPDANWSQQDSAVPGPGYVDQAESVFAIVRQTGNACDVISPGAPLDRYSIVIAPSLSIVDDALAHRFEEFAKAGGTLFFTPLSGSREITNARIATPLPGLLAPLAGITIEDFAAAGTVNFARGALIAQTCEVGAGCEVLELVSAESLAEYLDGRLKGKIAISRRSVGKGQVIYCGVHLPANMLALFLAEYLPEFPIKEIPPGVEVIQRKGNGRRIVFVINHAKERRKLKLPGQFPDLLTGETVGPNLTISANGILILKA
ncbi:MAG: beta-galactosidase [Candidatus Hydrogenedentes bacterium]|nr:beta-galactosidase [Candidatus Hydrogenedentota bacterium]